ncbi:MAG: dihydropteroate synthase [Gammaproteobacteria bacterium RIFCSPLOWO2_02_FULL_61_13]|nr:MAG: dihydropteroate synthase [Gammaproteobacteria bacterium RIFCSPLOWO2_02_FULL_61_13]
MTDHVLFLTGKLAEPRLQRVLESLAPLEFTFEVRNVGLSVAALMTAGMIERRVRDSGGAQRVMVPGLCRGDLDAASRSLGVPIVRGPDDLKDLPAFFGRVRKPVDLSRHDVRIFAEIVEARSLPVEAILNRARRYVADGADVIDLGCLPDTEFPHLEAAVMELKDAGMQVSVDSLQPEELLRGGRAGADFLLSLTEDTLWIANEVASTPVVIPTQQGDLASLFRCLDHFAALGRTAIADSVLDPIHFGFAESLQRYAAVRRLYPQTEVMMGTGNVTELTDADTTGINALLFGLISELGIRNVLTTEVSEHARSVVREADCARRIMYAARAEGSLPKGVDAGLLATHEKKPFPYTTAEIAELAADIRDPSYRVQVSNEGIHVYNRDGLVRGTDPFAIFPGLALLAGDAPHAFYMGVELERARTAWQLGKRYVQDEPLQWGVIVPEERRGNSRNAHALNKDAYDPEGATLTASRTKRGGKRKPA